MPLPDPWRDTYADDYGKHARPEHMAFQPYPVSDPSTYYFSALAGGCHAERVLCQINCGALESPETCEEYRDAYEHWHYHPARAFSRCSHE